jgi:hypothetical protein
MRPPTRRVFVAMIGAAATAFAARGRAGLRPEPADEDRPRKPAPATRWIGHC